jgi:dTDP-4-dehydrorhamnose reductase
VASNLHSLVITGGRGLLGQALVRGLGRRGVRCVATGSHECDITQPQSVERLFSTHHPTTLINCAAFTNVDGCEQDVERAEAVNGRAVGTLAAHARRAGCKLVHLSTDFVFDGAKGAPYRPEDAANPLNVYGRSKLLGEERIREADPPGWLIVRTSWLYGPDGRCFPRTILDAARGGRPLSVVADQIGSPTLTLDLAEILVDLVQRDAQGVFHASNTGQASWHDFALAVLHAFSATATVTRTTSAQWKAQRPAAATRPAYSVLDVSATEQALGRRIRSWHAALLDFARSGEAL